jgi:NarL family two-component system response regulator LiaR
MIGDERRTSTETMTPIHPIRVLIVDDHPMLRSGLALFIQTYPDLLLVGEASNGNQALEACRLHQPDVVLMDLFMPEMDGVTAIQLIRERFPSIQIVALSSGVDEDLVTSALEAGAVSYLLKNASIDALATAIRAAHQGKATLAAEAAQALVSAAQRPSIPSHPLTKREQEVLTLIVQGLSNNEIAEKLTIGISTVKKHTSRIFEKLGVTSRAAAVALAVRHELVIDSAGPLPS